MPALLHCPGGLFTVEGALVEGGWLLSAPMQVNGPLQWDSWKLWEGNAADEDLPWAFLWGSFGHPYSTLSLIEC